mgnify:CR=1 FL=1
MFPTHLCTCRICPLPPKRGSAIVVRLTTGTSRGQPRSTKHALLHPMHPKSMATRDRRACGRSTPLTGTLERGSDSRGLHTAPALVKRWALRVPSCVCRPMVRRQHHSAQPQLPDPSLSWRLPDGHWNGRWIDAHRAGSLPAQSRTDRLIRSGRSRHQPGKAHRRIYCRTLSEVRQQAADKRQPLSLNMGMPASGRHYHVLPGMARRHHEGLNTPADRCSWPARHCARPAA